MGNGGRPPVPNDISVPELQVRDIKKLHPQFQRKSLPTFTLIHPWVVTDDELQSGYPCER